MYAYIRKPRRRRYRTSKKYLLRRKSRCRCFYCTANRQYRNLKRLLAAEEKMKDWGEKLV